jgi:hypothetical protein
MDKDEEEALRFLLEGIRPKPRSVQPWICGKELEYHDEV